MTARAPATEVDALGLLCPLPVLRIAQAARRAAPGAVVVRWADDEQIVRDLPAWCAGTGHALIALAQQVHETGRLAWRAEVRIA